MALQPHTGRRLLAALALVVVSALAPVPAHAAEKGIATDLTWGISKHDRDRTVAGVQDLGAKWMRITISWNEVETAKGVYSTSRYDTAISRAVNSGAKILATVYTAPSWASGQSDPDSPPRNAADYADFLRWAATRWGDKIDAWEVWNEQNGSDFWSTGPNPAQYAQLLKAAYPAVKVADPTAQVVYGGVSGNDYRFVDGSYAAVPNLGDYYDVMATHPYTPGNPPEEMSKDDEGEPAEAAFPTYREVRRVMLAHGDDKPLWFTEFGWSTNTVKWGVSATQQAEYLTRALGCLEQDPYVEVAIWYLYRNHYWAKNANTWDDQLGLVDTDFSRKPAYAAFKNYTEGSQGCTYAYPPPPPQPEPEPQPVPAPDPAPLPQPADPPADPAPEPSADPAGDVESVSATFRVEMGLVLRSTVGRTARPSGRTALRVRGRVLRARRGRIDLQLRCVGRRESWRRNAQWTVDVNRDGTFTSRIRPRNGGSCRLRAAWHAFGQVLARSPVLRFRT